MLLALCRSEGLQAQRQEALQGRATRTHHRVLAVRVERQVLKLLSGYVLCKVEP